MILGLLMMMMAMVGQPASDGFSAHVTLFRGIMHIYDEQKPVFGFSKHACPRLFPFVCVPVLLWKPKRGSYLESLVSLVEKLVPGTAPSLVPCRLATWESCGRTKVLKSITRAETSDSESLGCWCCDKPVSHFLKFLVVVRAILLVFRYAAAVLDGQNLIDLLLPPVTLDQTIYGLNRTVVWLTDNSVHSTCLPAIVPYHHHTPQFLLVAFLFHTK